MTKVFGNQTTNDVERSGDRLPGRVLLDSGVYDAKVKAVYLGKSQSTEAQSLTVVLDVFQPEGPATEVSGTFWVSDREGKNHYTMKDGSGKKGLLPGYDDMDQFSLLTGGVPLNEASFEEKIVSIYNFEERKNEDVSRLCMVDSHGEKVRVGVQKHKLNKREKVGDEYVNKADTYETNVIVKFFDADTGRTVEEIKDGKTQPEFQARWTERYEGQLIDKSEKVSEGRSGAPKPNSPPERNSGGASNNMFKKPGK